MKQVEGQTAQSSGGVSTEVRGDLRQQHWRFTAAAVSFLKRHCASETAQSLKYLTEQRAEQENRKTERSEER